MTMPQDQARKLIMSEKVIVVTQPNAEPTVHRTRKGGADKARKNTGTWYSEEDKKSLGNFIEGREDFGVSGNSIVQEITLED